jgi:phosphoglycolate phosphatase
MKYRLLIFDFDGTLADSFPWFLRALDEAAARYRFRPLVAAEVETLRPHGARKMIEHLGVPAWKLPLIARHLRRAMARELDRITLFPGVSDLLPRLAHQGVTLAIVTSNSEENVRRVLGARNASLVQHYACGASLFGKRPLLTKVVRASGVPPETALCIGDEIRDQEAARTAGLPFGAVTWGYTHGDTLRSLDPEELFTQVDELLRVLAEDKPSVKP